MEARASKVAALDAEARPASSRFSAMRGDTCTREEVCDIENVASASEQTRCIEVRYEDADPVWVGDDAYQVFDRLRDGRVG